MYWKVVFQLSDRITRVVFYFKVSSFQTPALYTITAKPPICLQFFGHWRIAIIQKWHGKGGSGEIDNYITKNWKSVKKLTSSLFKRESTKLWWRFHRIKMSSLHPLWTTKERGSDIKWFQLYSFNYYNFTICRRIPSLHPCICVRIAAVLFSLWKNKKKNVKNLRKKRTDCIWNSQVESVQK